MLDSKPIVFYQLFLNHVLSCNNPQLEESERELLLGLSQSARGHNPQNQPWLPHKARLVFTMQSRGLLRIEY
jgi:hypothetical protein